MEKFCKTFMGAENPYEVVNENGESLFMSYCGFVTYPNVEMLTFLGKLSKCDINLKN